jgi:hypothetical protein
MSIWRICTFSGDFTQQGAFGMPTKFAPNFSVVHNNQKQNGLAEVCKIDYIHFLDAMYYLIAKNPKKCNIQKIAVLILMKL